MSAKKLLKENREVMDRLSDYLIEKETITGKEFMKIFREVTKIEEKLSLKEDIKETVKVVDQNQTPEEIQLQEEETRLESSEKSKQGLQDELETPHLQEKEQDLTVEELNFMADSIIENADTNKNDE